MEETREGSHSVLSSVSVGDDTKSLLYRAQGSKETGARRGGVRGTGAEPAESARLGERGWLRSHCVRLPQELSRRVLLACSQVRAADWWKYVGMFE